MSIRYPGDTQDALSMDDGSPWYMSPDVWLDTATATVGANTVNVRVHLLPDTTLPTSLAEVQVFVCNPSLVISPTSGSVLAGKALAARADLIASPTRSVATKLQPDWMVPPVDPANPDGANQPGHRCLIARVYPFGSAKPSDFQVLADQHEAQRNIAIVQVADGGLRAGGAGSPMGEPDMLLGPGEDGLWMFGLDTTSPGRDELATVEIRATRVLELSEFEREQILPLLDRAGFTGLSQAEPDIRLEFATEERVRDVEGTQRVFVELPCDRTARLQVKVDLREVAPQEAFAVRVEQLGAEAEVQGGILLVFHRVAG